jgi:hypothetical protein
MSGMLRELPLSRMFGVYTGGLFHPLAMRFVAASCRGLLLAYNTNGRREAQGATEISSVFFATGGEPCATQALSVHAVIR